MHTKIYMYIFILSSNDRLIPGHIIAIDQLGFMKTYNILTEKVLLGTSNVINFEGIYMMDCCISIYLASTVGLNLNYVKLLYVLMQISFSIT